MPVLGRVFLGSLLTLFSGRWNPLGRISHASRHKELALPSRTDPYPVFNPSVYMNIEMDIKVKKVFRIVLLLF